MGARWPLHFAVREGHAALVRRLLDAGAKPTGACGLYSGTDPVAFATERGLAEIGGILAEAMRRRFGTTAAGRDICEAVRDGDRDRVVALLDHAAGQVTIADERGNTPLHWAVMTRRVGLIQLLLDRGADVRARRADGMQPLHLTLHHDYYHRHKIVAMDDDSVLMGLLLARGAEYDACTAAAVGDLERVTALVQARAECVAEPNSAGFRPLSYAARRGHTAVVRFLLEHGADPNAPERDAPQGLALSVAVAKGHLDAARLLLERGADPQAEVESGGPLLSRALQGGHTEVVNLLYAHGATAGIVSHVWHGRLDVVGELLKVDPSLVDAGGDFSPLCAAVGNASLDMVRLLLRYRPTLNRPYYWGNHVCYACARREGPDRLDALRLLLEHGADPNLRNWLGISYLHLQAMRGDLDTAAILLEHGADIHARDEEWGSTPLGWAARWGQKDMVEFLLSRGAAPARADDPDWATPLAWAEKKGHPDIAALLRAAGATR